MTQSLGSADESMNFTDFRVRSMSVMNILSYDNLGLEIQIELAVQTLIQFQTTSPAKDRLWL